MQTRLQSFIESVINVAIGYGVALISQILVFPFFGIHITMETNLLIGAIFTVISIVRSYVVRRAFNRFTFVGNYGYNSRMEHFDSSVIDSIGGNAKVAELCNISSQAVSKWRREGIPQARRQFLELAFPEAFAEREEQKAA